LRFSAFTLLLVLAAAARSESLDASSLGVVYNADDPSSRAIAIFYLQQRSIPAINLVGVHLLNSNVVSPEEFAIQRTSALRQLPTNVQSLALVWSKPFAVGCMSITTAFAAGYRKSLCEPGCGRTDANPLFDSDGWLPADTVGWWPAMLIPTADPQLARLLIARGIAADGTRPAGTVYLVRTQDSARNVRAESYDKSAVLMNDRLKIVQLATPIVAQVPDAIGYFTGVNQVAELRLLHFLPGAAADHLTSLGGLLSGGGQMSALSWIEQGATGSFGNVSEPCNHLEKFPNVAVFLRHYFSADTLLQAYWKSVAMPGQGLFIGEPLARPFSPARR
jgi:uncharacterized protein (TIGR03790 family)